MEVTIKGTAKEIADLVLVLQGQQKEVGVKIDADKIKEVIAEGVHETFTHLRALRANRDRQPKKPC